MLDIVVPAEIPRGESAVAAGSRRPRGSERQENLGWVWREESVNTEVTWDTRAAAQGPSLGPFCAS